MNTKQKVYEWVSLSLSLSLYIYIYIYSNNFQTDLSDPYTGLKLVLPLWSKVDRRVMKTMIGLHTHQSSKTASLPAEYHTQNSCSGILYLTTLKSGELLATP